MTTEEVRRLARRCRRLGLRAQYLGNLTDQGWDAVRHYIDAEDATNLELADAVDRLIDMEEGLDWDEAYGLTMSPDPYAL